MKKNVGSRAGRSSCARFVLALIPFLSSAAGAQTYTVLQQFIVNPGQPAAPLVQGTDGSFYGTTSVGGAGDRGTIFKIDSSGAVTTLHDFMGVDGGNPHAGLIQATDGNFYGTTVNGGANGQGAIFKMDSLGNLTTLHSFTGTDGYNPFAGLIQAADGDFYGTTDSGGSAGGMGTVFRMNSSGTLTTLHTFTGGDGSNPDDALLQANDGHLYGTTTYGGANGCGTLGCGTVFRMDSSGNLTVLHSFSGSDGSYPSAGLIQAHDGNFYGATPVGGTNGTGTVFRMDSSGNLITLHNFSGNDGSSPDSSLIQATDGNFYGSTPVGGTDDRGTVFRMDSSGDLIMLHSFTGADGDGPTGGLIQATDRDFYGTTRLGGTESIGTAFRMDLSGNISPLHLFLRATAGSGPVATLIQATDAYLYGVTSKGGTNDLGTVFRTNTSGNLTTLHSFAGDDGYEPGTGLVQATDGNFYGTTSRGGANDLGTIFKMDLLGTLTKIHTFDGSDGSYPGDIIQSRDGNFYGTTGGGVGTIFRMDAFGNLVTVHSFSGSDGAGPECIIQATDGNLYGTTGAWGTNDHGTVFRIDSTGNLTTIHSFSGVDGSSPGCVVQAADGNLYGATSSYIAIHTYGTFYRMDLAGNLTTLHIFTMGEGHNLQGRLIQASDGAFYGAAQWGGVIDCVPNGCGTVFKMDSSGGLTTLHSFTGGDGSNPEGGLVEAADGQLYGTTFAGGAAGVGVVFRLGLCLPPVASSNSPVCPGQTAQLSAFPSAGATYSWAGPNGFGSALQAPTIPNVTAAAAGTYTVTVTAGDCSSAQASVEVVVNPGVPPAPVITSSHCVLPNAPGLAASVPANPGDTYTWTIAGGTITGGQGTDSITFTSGDVGVPVRLSVLESNGSCSGADAKIVQVDFADVPASNPFHDFICRIAENGITAGCGAGSFCPADNVLRSQIAVFLLRGEHGLAYLPPAATGVFGDVSASNPFAPWVEQLYSEGITGGCSTNPLLYCPSNPVSRAGMAVFLLVAEHGTGYTPPACAGIFSDVACPGPFTDWIEQLYNEGITGGCSTNPLHYCPGNSVVRAQMAVFLTATFALP